MERVGIAKDINKLSTKGLIFMKKIIVGVVGCLVAVNVIAQEQAQEVNIPGFNQTTQGQDTSANPNVERPHGVTSQSPQFAMPGQNSSQSGMPLPTGGQAKLPGFQGVTPSTEGTQPGIPGQQPSLQQQGMRGAQQQPATAPNFQQPGLQPSTPTGQGAQPNPAIQQPPQVRQPAAEQASH